MKIPESKYKSNVLRGKDLTDSTEVVIKEVGEVTFKDDQGNEKDPQISLAVEGEDAKGSFCPNMRNLRELVEKLGDETDDWVGKKIRITPVPSQMPNGTPTKGIAITVPKKK